MAAGTFTVDAALAQQSKGGVDNVFMDIVNIDTTDDYVTGGYAGATAKLQAAIGASREIFFVCEVTSPYVIRFDKVNDKLLVYIGNDAGPADEHAAAALALTDVKLLVLSK